MTVENQTLGQALNEVTEESLDAAETTTEETETTETEESGEETTETETEGEAEETTEEEESADEVDESEEEADAEADIFDNLTPEQYAKIKANPELNVLRKALMKGYESRTTEFKQLVQLGEAWKQNPARVVNALADSLGLTVTQAKAVAAQAGAAADAAAHAQTQTPDPIDAAGKELESLFGDQLGPRVRAVFDKWADARIGKSLGSEMGPVKNALGQVINNNEQARMMNEETTFKSRHKDLTPVIEKRIVELGNSGKYVPGKGQTPQEYLEALHDIATAQLSRETARKASGNAAKKLAKKIEANRKDREPSGVSGRGGSVKPVSKISKARNISEALDIANAELEAEGL